MMLFSDILQLHGGPSTKYGGLMSIWLRLIAMDYGWRHSNLLSPSSVENSVSSSLPYHYHLLLFAGLIEMGSLFKDSLFNVFEEKIEIDIRTFLPPYV